MPINVRVAVEGDREILHRLNQQAFTDRPDDFDAEADRAKIPLERRLVATDGDAIVGKLEVWEFGQWFGGRRVPMGGVAGVAVEPAYRGRGVASALLRAGVDAMRAEVRRWPRSTR